MTAIVDGRPTGRDVEQARFTTSAGRKASPILSALDHLITNQDNRHAWLYAAGAQVRRWREEDRENGIIWGDETPPQDNERIER